MSCPNFEIEVPVVHGEINFNPLLPVGVEYTGKWIVSVVKGGISTISATEEFQTGDLMHAALQFTKNLSVYLASKYRNRAITITEDTDNSVHLFSIDDHNRDPEEPVVHLLSMALDNNRLMLSINQEMYHLKLVDLSNERHTRPFVPSDYSLVLQDGSHVDANTLL